ncbi:MAG: hypothetical protein ABUT11_01335 [Leifsonia sp.]
MLTEIETHATLDVSVDRAAVAREFAAIMTRAGFGDRVVAAATAPRGLESGESTPDPAVHPHAAATTADSRHSFRVRSPPGVRYSTR